MADPAQSPDHRIDVATESIPSPRLRNVARLGRRFDLSVEHLVATSALLRAYRLVILRADAALEPFDLTMSRLEILGYLAATEEGSLSFRDLKRAVLVHSATLTYTIDQLEERKLIRRRKDPDDRRAFLAEITRSGRALLAAAMEELKDEMYGLDGLTADECTELTGLLAVIPGFEEDPGG